MRRACHSSALVLGVVLAAASVRARAEGPVPTPVESAAPVLNLSAVLGAGGQPVRANLHWRVFNEAANADGSHDLVAESRAAAPALQIKDGQYIVHVAYGLAAATKRVVVGGATVTERLAVNAGGLKIIGVIGDAQIPANRLKVSVFVPLPGNSEAKLVLDHAKASDLIALPEGSYHVVSTYLDAALPGSQAGAGVANATNSVVSADLKVQTGKLTEATLRHRAATPTLKLVNKPGGEALANTSFTVLTPGGDVIRELVGAFPSLVLAEGDYVAIARHDGKAVQQDFKVESGLDRDVEIMNK